MRGQLYEELNEPNKALVDYAQAFKTDQKDSVVSTKSIAMKLRSALLSKQGKHKEAIKDLDAIISIQPDNDELLRLRGEQYYKLKDYKNAISDFTEAIEMAPHFSRLTFEARSKAYKAIGEDELAEKDLASAAKIKESPAERPIY